MLPLFLASLALVMVTSCPFLPCVFMFTHLGINACPLHLLLLNFLSAHSSPTQSSCGFFPSLFATCIFRTCLQFIPHWPFITHVDDLPTHFIVHNNLVSPSAALYHDNHSVCNSTTPSGSAFSSDPLWFCYTFPLWLSQHFRVFSAHTHTQAPIFLSQRSRIVSHFPLQWILAYSIAACYLPLAIHCAWF